MTDFLPNANSGRNERWTQDGHRWVAAEPRGSGYHLWGYQNDTSDVVYLGGGIRQEQLEQLADQFLLGDPETISATLFCKDVSAIPSRRQAQH
jgi:hypothetical protein